MRGPSPGTIRSALRRGLAAALAVLVSGCVSFSVDRRKDDGGTGIRIAVYPESKDAKAARPGPYGVLSELYVQDGKEWRRLKVSLLPEWSVASPPAGRYRVVVERRISEQGHIEALKGTKAKEFTLAEGERVDVRILLKGKPVTGAIVVAVLVGLVIIWALVEAFSGGDVDLPDLPLPPPEAVAVAGEIFLNAGWSAAAAEGTGWGDSTAPRLIANFPLHLDPRSDPGTHLYLNFSEAVRPDWDGETFQVIGSESGRVAGQFAYHPGGDMVEFVPDEPLRSGETVTATLDGDRVEDFAGNAMSDKVSYSFSVR